MLSTPEHEQLSNYPSPDSNENETYLKLIKVE